MDSRTRMPATSDCEAADQYRVEAEYQNDARSGNNRRRTSRQTEVIDNTPGKRNYSRT
jgi:hypothetical protein